MSGRREQAEASDVENVVDDDEDTPLLEADVSQSKRVLVGREY